MSYKLHGDDHLIVGPPIDEERHAAQIHRGDGEVVDVQVVLNGNEKGQRLSRCEDAPEGVRAFHAGDNRGPARVNSRAFCEGWERLFGKKSEHGGN